MKRQPHFLIELLTYVSVYPLLVIILVVSGFTCSFAFTIGNWLTQAPPAAPPTIARRLARLPTAAAPTLPPETVTHSIDKPETSTTVVNPQSTVVANTTPIPTELPPSPPVDSHINESPKSIEPSPAEETNSKEINTANAYTPMAPSATPTLALDMSAYVNRQATSRPVRRTATPTPNNLINELVTSLMEVIEEPTTPALPKIQFDTLPTLTPTPTDTATPTATATPPNTATPTETPLPTHTPIPTKTPLPSATPLPTNTPKPTPIPLPADTPVPTATPLPEYDFMLAEFFNSPTTNSFLVMYVAVVDTNEIPIGDMKIVGTRLDHNLTYESPLSTWHFEGYNAPGQVIKSGNVKFEPPGGIENTSWIIHLEDAHSNRLSDDVPFDTLQDDKQWYFVKFKRKY